jgi:hypothetical protein
VGLQEQKGDGGGVEAAVMRTFPGGHRSPEACISEGPVERTSFENRNESINIREAAHSGRERV